jgi:hypothetical protein
LAGRPAADYDENIIKKIIIDFHQNINTKPVVKPVDILKYATSEFEKGLFPYETTYDFWKRKGRIGKELIEEFNLVRKKTYSISKGVSYDIVDVADLIEKHNDDKDALIKYLVPFERQIRSLIMSLDQINEKNSNLEKEIATLKDELKHEKIHSNKLQTLLYQLFTYGPTNTSLDNLINTGTSRTERVSLAIKEAFNNPKDFLDNFPSYHENIKAKSKNVISLRRRDHANDLNDKVDDWDL